MLMPVKAVVLEWEEGQLRRNWLQVEHRRTPQNSLLTCLDALQECLILLTFPSTTLLLTPIPSLPTLRLSPPTRPETTSFHSRFPSTAARAMTSPPRCSTALLLDTPLSSTGLASSLRKCSSRLTVVRAVPRRLLRRRLTQATSADWDVLLNDGNTDGWSKIVRLLLEAGDTILTEEFSFPSVSSLQVSSRLKLTLSDLFLVSQFRSTIYALLPVSFLPRLAPSTSQAQAAWIPYGVVGVPIKMDEHGLRADHLRRTLQEWETTRPGLRRPKL